ncbi:MAG: UDP-N-acetylmuramoylalanyl-D-glutamyl-2,6-diaminopimelate--D-alanyl-D-alanine ligase [Pseudomonadota bacterium]|nr:UDP-N-acetylmuramoylalanyl-D-glutamyl-2,6-diaminopimelate--D-alanyl-D-alanine ligase [Pseudomonadota bacterium]
MTVQLIWKAEDVIRAVHGHCLHEQTWTAHGVSIDSRTTKEGDLFIALEGPDHDGHDFIAAAFAAGAAAAIVSRQPSQAPAKAHLILVEDTFKALQELGRAGRKRSHARIIAVTGSVGKTGSKEMLRLMLNEVGDTYANEGSLNNHWGVPLSLARLPAGALYGVFEMGMNHAGELGPLSQQVRPDVAFITTIEAVHLEYFDSVEAIADAKAEIFSGMTSDGTAVLNRDNGQFVRLAAAGKTSGLKKILGFGRDGKADGRILECIEEVESSLIKAEILGRRIEYRLGVPGLHVALNSIGALLAAVTAGADLNACAAVLAHYRQPKGRGVIQTVTISDGNFTLIDESYNASPVAVRFALRVLGQMMPGPQGRRILVLGDMKELGASSPSLHADLIKDITDAHIDMVFTCGEMMRHLFEALPETVPKFHADNSAGLVPHVTKAVRAGDVVTVKGSHSMHMDVVVDELKALDHAAPQNERRAV